MNDSTKNLGGLITAGVAALVGYGLYLKGKRDAIRELQQIEEPATDEVQTEEESIEY